MRGGELMALSALRELSKKTDCGMNELLNLALSEFLKTVEIEGEKENLKKAASVGFEPTTARNLSSQFRVLYPSI